MTYAWSKFSSTVYQMYPLERSMVSVQHIFTLQRFVWIVRKWNAIAKLLPIRLHVNIVFREISISSGSSTNTTSCANQLCGYPRRVCCLPHAKKLVNGKYVCVWKTLLPIKISVSGASSRLCTHFWQKLSLCDHKKKWAGNRSLIWLCLLIYNRENWDWCLQIRDTPCATIVLKGKILISHFGL